MPNSVLVKTNLKGAIAESIINEIDSNTNRYYYFFGRPYPWNLEYEPEPANDSFRNEMGTRWNMIYAKQISTNDVNLVVPRIDWVNSTVFDIFDDEYSTEVIGINLISGGSGYNSAPTVTISGTGTGASATATVSSVTRKVTDIKIVNRGTNYIDSVNTPVVINISGGDGTGASALPVLARTQANKNALEFAKFYVLTDDYNVYVCLNNNLNAQSTVKPYGTSSLPITLTDGYIWKFLYSIPLSLRNRFLTPEYMPVANSLKSQFFSRGSISNVKINSGGTGYTTLTQIQVTGDGCSEANPVVVNSVAITLPNNGGVGYTTAAAVFDPPFGGTLASTAWAATRLYIQGQYVSYLNNVYIVDVGGISNSTPPTHLTGSVLNGASYKYMGTVAEANLTVSGGVVTAAALKFGIRSVTVTNGGSGYANGPNTVTFSSGTATAVSYAQNGVIYRVDITDRALNTYTTAPTITSFGGGGTGATGTVVVQSGFGYQVNPGVTVTGTGGITTIASLTAASYRSSATVYPIVSGGSIVGTQIVDPGIGYSTASLSVTGNGTGASLSTNFLTGDITTLQANIELSAIDGAIYNIPVVSGGYGYNTIPTVRIRGDGINATATAVIVGGVITRINVTNPGSGYKYALIDILSDSGTGARARAILSPYGGHSKNIVRALNSKTLLFQTDISKDKVNGVNLGIEYRQFGIMRNPFSYGTKLYSTEKSLTACWTVTSASNIPVAFTNNSIATVVPSLGKVTTTVGTVTSGTVFTVSSITGIQVGMAVSGVGVSSGTTVTSIVGSLVTVSASIAAIATSLSLSFNFAATYRIIYVNADKVILQSIENNVPSVGDIFTLGSDTFTSITVSAPNFDKYSGDLLYQNNQIPFNPLDNASEKITVSTVLKF